LLGSSGADTVDGGAGRGVEIAVNGWTARDQINPEALEMPDGGFVGVWQSAGLPSTQDIHGQRFDAGGGTGGDEFIVNDVHTLDFGTGTKSGPRSRRAPTTPWW
jgi:hypothetical protein